jgi:single-stranded DNA-binding protein
MIQSQNLNQWIGEGNISQNPVVRFTTGSNRPVTNFYIYVNATYKSKKESSSNEVVFKKRTSKIPIVAWAGKAETIAKYYAKGDKVRIVGTLRTRPAQKEGISYNAFEIVVENISLITKASQEH